VYEVLEVGRPGDHWSRWIDLSLITLVAMNLVAVILESVESVGTSYVDEFARFELVSVVVFSVEYGLRLWTAGVATGQHGWRACWNYVRRPLAIADLLSIAPFYLAALFQIDLRFLRVLRLLRAFKLTRYSGAMRVLFDVVYQERAALGSAFFILCVMLVAASSGIYLVERTHQPEDFGSIPSAMWWALATLTTVGYGDVTPVTSLGKLFAAAVMVVGICTVALPTSIMASGFQSTHERNHRRLRAELEEALEDGVFDRDESDAYRKLAEKLGVPAEIAEEMASRAERRMHFEVGPEACPHCGKSLE
jgi:voltage-gated potassium channel